MSIVIVGIVFVLTGLHVPVVTSAQHSDVVNENINYSENGKKTLSYRDMLCQKGCIACDNPFAPHCGDLVSRDRRFTIFIEEDDAENTNNTGKEVLKIELPDYVALDRTCVSPSNRSNDWINYAFSKKKKVITATLTGTTGDQSGANTTKNQLVGGEQEKTFILEVWNCQNRNDFVRIAIRSFLYNHYEEPEFNTECQNIAMEEFQKGVVLYTSNCVEKTGGEFIKDISISQVPKNTFPFGNDPNSNFTLQTIGNNHIEEITERVTEGGIRSKKIDTTMNITYCAGKIESNYHSDCAASEAMIKNIAFTIENVYDEPKKVSCNPSPMCGGPNAAITIFGASCFTGTGLTITPETTILSLGRNEPEFSKEITACNTHPLTNTDRCLTATTTLRNLRDTEGNCNTTQTSDRNIEIDITTKEGARELSDDEIYNSGYRVESITFEARDISGGNNPQWRHWYLPKEAICAKSINTEWSSGIGAILNTEVVGYRATLDEEGDNDYFVCFGAKRGGEEPVYRGIKYRAVIDTGVGNYGIRLAPGAPMLLSGIADPGATIEITFVKSNGVTIAQGNKNPTTTADAEGNWSLPIVNAIFPNTRNTIEVGIKTDDGFHPPLLQKQIITVGEDGTTIETEKTEQGGSTPPGNRQNTTQEFIPDTRQEGQPTPTPSPFTISAKPTTITEGEEITWTITRTKDATGQNATVSCRERGAWGATPLTKDVTIPRADGTQSFAMKTTNDDTLEQSGFIICFVGAKSNPSVASNQFSVKVRSDDRAKESSLIIDCTFGKEKYTFDTGEHKAGDFKEQCGIKHLFQLANNIIKWLIWLALVGAGALIFFRGVKLATNVFDKGGHQEARKKVQDALKATLIGLIVILGAYLIVKAGFDIIGYNLNGGDPFKWNESTLPAPDVSQLAPKTPPPSTTSGTQGRQSADTAPQTPTAEPQQPTDRQQGGFSDLQGSGVPHKDPGLNGCKGDACFVGRNLLNKLNRLKTGASSVSWWVTESCPPTITHSHSCHRVENCDCVDINFRIAGTNNSRHNPTAQEVKDFIATMQSAGLYAVYEIPKTGNTYKDLRTALPDDTQVPGGEIQHYNVGHPHFSVYESRAVRNRR